MCKKWYQDRHEKMTSSVPHFDALKNARHREGGRNRREMLWRILSFTIMLEMVQASRTCGHSSETCTANEDHNDLLPTVVICVTRQSYTQRHIHDYRSDELRFRRAGWFPASLCSVNPRPRDRATFVIFDPDPAHLRMCTGSTTV
jgi:hypothetical protein